MTEQNKKAQSTAEILSSLNYLAKDFNRQAECKASADKKVAEVLESASRALQEEQQKNQELQRQLSALQLSVALKHLKQKKIKGKNFTFLIDGSGSMAVPCGSIFSPLRQSLEGVKTFSQATAANVTVRLWGDNAVHVIKDTDFRIAEQGLESGTDFAPAVDYMQSAASTTKKLQHFIVLGDGDMSDQRESLLKAQELLKLSSKTTIDFVIISYRKSSAIETLAKDLQQKYPAQVGLHFVVAGRPLDKTLVIIAAQRTQAPKAKNPPNLNS